MAYTWEQFYRKYSRIQSVTWIRKLHFKITATFPKANELTMPCKYWPHVYLTPAYCIQAVNPGKKLDTDIDYGSVTMPGTLSTESQWTPKYLSIHLLPFTYKVNQKDKWFHDDVIKRKHFLRYWPFMRGIHRSLVNSRHKGQWCRTLMFSFICAWINSCEAGDLRCHHAHYEVTVMICTANNDKSSKHHVLVVILYSTVFVWKILTY